ncbi:hypothetical protein KDN32_15945 [Nocardioides sp. J2M5]|uniref:hypothetical protein n=1 Tax=Nocardioides palaemonis TaxID=2829810 RepID=UPI001BAB70CF|nr:hypothetical protein [Nocardioides palaemonis]MBS2939234.1 hypothetical protein [Nocardioides palaemonis]
MLRARSPRRLARTLLPAVLLATAPALSGCLGDEPTVALLVADGSSGGGVDVEEFTDRVEATCDECRVRVYDAEGDAEAQRSQVRQAEADSADVVVVVPVDADAIGDLSGRDVPVVSLGDLVPGSDRFVGLEGGGLSDIGGSDLDAARDVLLGEEESMTYVPVRAMSEQAADVAVALLAGNPVPGGERVEGVESWLYAAQDVTVDTLTTVLVGQGVVTLDDLCSGATEKRCERFGLR